MPNTIITSASSGFLFFFFSSRRRHTRFKCDWSSDVCSSDLAVPAPNPRAAAEYYPATYWYSLLHIPDKSEFPGTGPKGNGISPNMKSQAEWLELVKTDSCWSCHQLGTKATREIPKSLGVFNSPAIARGRPIQSRQTGSAMVGGVGRLGKERALALFADWTN